LTQGVSTGDLVIGTIGLVIFLIVVLLAALLLSRFRNARFAKAWASLVPIVRGTITGDGGGAATSWLSGTYRGRPVRASMIPGRNRYTESSEHRYNHFDVALLDVAGRRDWSIGYHPTMLGLGKAKWQIEADDAALVERLRNRGLVDAVARLGQPTISFRAREGALQLSEDAGPHWIPPPERFEEELALLIELVAINAEVNPP
jgi:hypothetical protein